MMQVATEEERPDPSFFLHNLRNYVGSVITSAERLKADKTDERAIQLISKAANLALRDLQAFSDLSRPLDLKTQSLRLASWLRDVVAKRELAKLLKVEFSDDSPDQIAHADPAFLADAVDAVISNSAENMPEGGAIGLGVGLTSEGWSSLWFEDRGGPIVRDVTLEMIGAPFFTLKPNRLGLGLSRARHIVHQHGGKLEIARSPLGGLRVEMILPPASPV